MSCTHKQRRERETKGELTTLLWCQFPTLPTTTLLTKTDPTVDHIRSKVGPVPNTLSKRDIVPREQKDDSTEKKLERSARKRPSQLVILWTILFGQWPYNATTVDTATKSIISAQKSSKIMKNCSSSHIDIGTNCDQSDVSTTMMTQKRNNSIKLSWLSPNATES
eukprot:8357446-Ditylum_brightwellii.AAC.1